MPAAPDDRAASGNAPSARRNNTDGRFLPNLKQLEDAASDLPDPETFAGEQFEYRVRSGGRSEYLVFERTAIQRGARRTFRWVYEGKILIRKRDLETD